MNQLGEELKLDVALPYQILATPAPGVTSRYYKMDRNHRTVFVADIDTLATGEDVVLEIWEDLINTGATGAAIGGVAPSATCQVDANTLATVISITCGIVNVGDTVTINGVIFTAAAAPDWPNQVFDQVSGVAATIATDLFNCINAAASQVLLAAASGGAGITATNGVATVVELTVTEAGAYTLTVVEDTAAARMQIATVQAIAYIEVEGSALSAADSWVALNLVGPATAHATVACIRGNQRYEPVTQRVAASDTDS